MPLPPTVCVASETQPTRRERDCALEHSERECDHLRDVMVDAEFETSRGDRDQVCLVVVGSRKLNHAAHHDGGCPGAPREAAAVAASPEAGRSGVGPAASCACRLD